MWTATVPLPEDNQTLHRLSSPSVSSPLSLAGLVVVLDELGLDVFPQRVIVFGRPVSQDAGGELVFGVTGSTQNHLHHLLARPGTHTQRQTVRDKDPGT